MKAVGFVLAGGRSRRMGADKALLPWGSTTLLDHAAARLAAVCGEVNVLCGGTRRYAEQGLPLIVDAVPGVGSLGGLLAGVEHLDERPGLFLAVDLPHATPRLLRHLLDCAEGFDAVVPVAAAGPEPLCAVYRRACAAAMRRRLAAGELKLTAFWPDVRVRRLGDDDLARFGDPRSLFANLNTPDDYERARHNS